MSRHRVAYDGEISFDKSSSLLLAHITHIDDQRGHILFDDEQIPLSYNLPHYQEPAQRYCSAGVYEIVSSNSGKDALMVNAQNCIHCKVCDIKDPSQNISWSAPEGGSGPNYGAM